MAQKQIPDFFSPSNFPPKKREREGEPPVVSSKKRKKTAALQRVNNKRKDKNESNLVEKKLKLNDTRAQMEKAVENRNELFNTKKEIRMSREDQRGGLTLETINVNSLIDIGRLTRMKALLNQWNNDVAILVDTRIPEYRAKRLRSDDTTIYSTNKQFRGVIIQINKRLDPGLIEADEENANYLAVSFNINWKKVGLLGIYAPNKDDSSFFREIINKVLTKMSLETDELIVAGDFNVNFSASIGYSNKRSYKKEALEDCMKVWNLKDTIDHSAKKCEVEPLTYIHTTRNEGPDKDIFPLKAARLDTILTTIDPSKTEVSIGKFYPSDHASVRACFQEE